MVEVVVYFICAAICIMGAAGVVWSRNPVHSALSLIATLFGIAVLFINLNAQFLGAVQVIVYTGAIVVLILFVMMLLGVDRNEDLEVEPLVGQRVGAYLLGAVLILGIGAVVLVNRDGNAVTGEVAVTAPVVEGLAATTPGQVVRELDDLGPEESQVTAENNIRQIGDELFSTYVFAFQITAALLTIAVIGAVLMAKRPRHYEPLPEPEEVDAEVDAVEEAG